MNKIIINAIVTTLEYVSFLPDISSYRKFTRI